METLLTTMIDGGDTETLNAEVETSTPPEAATVYNELMAESPNLSETVVESTIEKETVIPNAMLRDVMVANPHTANSQVLLNMLDERFDPMPDYMKAQILAGRSLQSLKQELESQLASHKLRKAKAMNAIIRYYQEEIEDPQAASDSILALLQNDNTPKSAYRLAWLYFEKGSYTSGQNVISNILVLYVLDDATLQRHQNISDVYNMLCALYANGISPDSLSASQVIDLQTLANEGEIPARAYARNILLQAEEVEYDEPILLPDLFKSAQAIDEYNDVMKAEAPKQINVYPNPSTDYVILEYYLEAETEGSIEIKNVNGVLMHTVATQGKQDQLSIITKGWNPGIYIASLIIGGKTTESIKFTIVK